MKRLISVRSFRKNRDLLLLALPGVLFIFLFSYVPLYGLIIPFKNFQYDLGLWRSPWVGFDNFRFLFNSEDVLRATWNTVSLNTAFIFLLLVVSVAFALMLNELSRKAIRIYQTTMFFPYFLSWVVVSYVFLGLLDMEHGLINNLLQSFGLEAVLWYNEPVYWPFLLTAGNTWKGAGYFAIIYYTGLLGIDQEYYEAADLDGASRLRQVWHISLPLLKPLIAMMVLLQVGRIFYGNFDLFYNLPRDSAALYETTDVIDTYVFRALRSTGDIGMASAAGVYQSVVGFFIVLASNLVIKRINPENALF